MDDNQRKIDSLINWFLNSRIYDGESYRSYYSMINTGLPYPEITSYALSVSSILYKMNDTQKYLERAKSCYQYLIKISKNGAIPAFEDNNYYVFDTGIFVNGLLDLYEVDYNEEYLIEAKRSADWILSNFDGNSFAPSTSLGKIFWYHKSSIHLVKMAIPLLKLSKISGEDNYQQVAIKILDQFAKLQNSNGSFLVNTDSEVVMAHPHCYATEGYLYAYYFLKDSKYLEIAKNASDWLIKNQNVDGSFNREYYSKINNNPKTTDATAQSTRIWKLLGTNEHGISKAYGFLDEMINSGGLILLKKGTLSERILPCQKTTYSWPTFFYLHSLLLHYNRFEECSDLF
jgi:uncharacterized protein YyaL (SSP411 family)